MTHYWLPIEQEWFANHSLNLSPFMQIAEATHDFVAELAQCPEFVSRPASVTTTAERLLVRRLGEELRGVELLAVNGHGYQAISAAANLFEQSHFLTYASAVPQAAQHFIDSSNPKKGVASVKDVVTMSGRQRGWNEARIADEYEKYSFLCGFKHSNGFMQRALLLKRDPDLVLGQLAICDSVWFVLTTMGFLALTSLPGEAAVGFADRCNQLCELHDALPNISIHG